MTTNTNLITLNYFNFTSVLADVANPFVNPETIIVMDITAHNAFTVLNEIAPKFTALSVTATGTTAVDTEGVRFAFYSTLDNTLTITPSYKDRFFTNLEGKVNLVALGGGETPALNVTPTASTSVVNNPAFQQQQEDAQVEQFNEDGLDEHYYANYGEYNTHITPIDMDAERDKSPNSFAIPPQEFATPNFTAPQTTAPTFGNGGYAIGFTGHRPGDLPTLDNSRGDYEYTGEVSRAILNSMYAQLNAKLQEHGKITVISGMAQGIDQMAIIAADALRSAVGADKVHIHGAIPCKNYENGWAVNGKPIQRAVDQYKALLAKCDSSHVVVDSEYKESKALFSNKPKGENCAMGQRNLYMINNANEMFAFSTMKAYGGTMNCINSAKARNVAVTVTNINEIFASLSSQTTQQEVQAKRVLAVDGACSGNPGTFEFQMVWADNGEQLNHKHYGELIGTNNIAEVLGLCTAAHYVVSNNLQDSVAIKYDSITAKAWLDKGAHKITSKKVSPQAIQNVENALSFINSNRELINKIEFVKHDTKANGEIEADFNRKK